jgi:multicomponent Na+:H+ antiporter subunit F
MTLLATICLCVIVACLGVCVFRVARGPHALDRLIGFDLVGVLLAVGSAQFAIVQENWAYLEISMGLAVLAFVGTVAIAHFVEREKLS